MSVATRMRVRDAALTDAAVMRAVGRIRLVACPTAARVVLSLAWAGEMNVGMLADAAGCSRGNISRYLANLTAEGLVDRRTAGAFRLYRCTNLGRSVVKVLRTLVASDTVVRVTAPEPVE